LTTSNHKFLNPKSNLSNKNITFPLIFQSLEFLGHSPSCDYILAVVQKETAIMDITRYELSGYNRLSQAIINSNILSSFTFSRSPWSVFQDKSCPGAFTKPLIDLHDHTGPVSAMCLSKAPNIKIKGKLVLRYLVALGS